jgi:hypothetical protein
LSVKLPLQQFVSIATIQVVLREIGTQMCI